MFLEKSKKAYLDMLQETSLLDETKPATEEEIRNLERELGISIPDSYKEFLLWLGRDTGYFMQGEDFRIGELRRVREGALEILQDGDCQDSLPEDAIIFTMHHGYMFGFLRALEGNNPPVHFYIEDEESDRIYWNYFSNLDEYLLDYINMILEVHRRKNIRVNS